MTAHNPQLDALAPRHQRAIESAVSFITGRFGATGILVAGTIVRGEGHANSDLDFAVVHDKPWRQRIQRFENGVPVEIFVNPVSGFERSFERECASGAPAMLGILSSGVPLRDDLGSLTPLIAKAKHLMQAGPTLTPESLTALRYAIASQFEDAIDLRHLDPARSRAFIAEAVTKAARFKILQSGRWLPREKVLFATIDLLFPDLGDAIRALFAAPADRWAELAAPIVQSVIGTTRFFAWESEPQDA